MLGTNPYMKYQLVGASPSVYTASAANFSKSWMYWSMRGQVILMLSRPVQVHSPFWESWNCSMKVSRNQSQTSSILSIAGSSRESQSTALLIHLSTRGP